MTGGQAQDQILREEPCAGLDQVIESYSAQARHNAYDNSQHGADPDALDASRREGFGDFGHHAFYCITRFSRNKAKFFRHLQDWPSFSRMHSCAVVRFLQY